MKYDHILRQLYGRISTIWIIPENPSVVYFFFNRNLLKNTRKDNRNISIFLTGGKTTTNLVWDLSGYGTNWFHPGGIPNTLYLSKVAEKCRVWYDSTNGNNCFAHLACGEMRRLLQFHRGLLYSNMTDSQVTVLINTVEDNRSRYSEHSYFRALEVRNIKYKV